MGIRKTPRKRSPKAAPRDRPAEKKILSEAQKIVAIAKLCGWTKIIEKHDKVLPFSWFWGIREPGWPVTELPNYLTNEHAMWEVEEKLLTTKDLQDRYLDILLWVILSPPEVEYGPIRPTAKDRAWWTCHARASYRAESILRLFGIIQ